MLRRLCLAVAIAGCGGTAAPPSVVPPAYRSSAPALAETSAVAYLHRDTVLLAVAGSPAALDRATGWVELARTRSARLPALDELAAAGVAVDRPAGVALVDPTHDTWVAFAEIADRSRLAQWVARLARGDGGALQPSRAGDATVFLPVDDAGIAVVLRGSQVLFMWTAGAKSTRDLAAVRLAALERADSVAETDDYRRLVGALGFGRDLTVYASSSWLAAGDGSEIERALELEQRLSSALRAAHEQNDAQTAATLERQLAMVRQIAAAAARAERYRMEVGGQLGPLAIGVEVRDDRLHVAAVAHPAAGSAVDRVLPGTRAPHPIAAAVGRPALVLSAHLDPAAVGELVDGWLTSRGSGLARLRQAATSAGADLDRGLLDNLAGELVFAVSGTPTRALEVTVAARVTRADDARQFLAALGASGAASRDGDATVIPIGLAAPLRLVVVGGYVIASTDPAMTRESNPDPGAVAAARLILAAWMALGGTSPTPSPPRLVALRPDDHPAPLSDEYLSLRGTLDAERARADELGHADQMARANHVRDLGVIIGALELTVEREGGLVRAYGTVSSPAGGVSAAARELSDAARRARADADRRATELAERTSRIDALAGELERRRQRDIDAWETARQPK